VWAESGSEIAGSETGAGATVEVTAAIPARRERDFIFGGWTELGRIEV
jgi:hypothetical protein